MNTETTPEPPPESSADAPRGQRTGANRARGPLNRLRRRGIRAPRSSDDRVSDVSLKRRLSAAWWWQTGAFVVGLIIAAALTFPIAAGMVLITGSVQNISIPAVGFLASVAKERTSSLHYLLSPTSSDPQELRNQREQTDKLLSQVRQATDEQWILKVAPPAEPIRTRLDTLLQRGADLDVLRARVDGRQLNQDEIYAAYNRIVDAGGDMFNTQARTFPDPIVAQGGIQAMEWFQAADRQQRAASLVSAALETRSFDQAHYEQFVRLVNVYHYDVETPSPVAPPHVSDLRQRITTTDNWRRLTALENQLVAHGPWPSAGGAPGSAAVPPVSLQEWVGLTEQVSNDLNDLVVAQADYASLAGWNQGWRNIWNILIVGVLVVGIAVVAGRRSRKNVTALNRRFKYLLADMERVSDKLLPDIFARMGRGDLRDITSMLPSQKYGSDEVAMVKKTFDGVVEIAVNRSLEHFRAQEGMRSVLVKLARRNKVPINNGLKNVDELVKIEELPETAMDYVFEIDRGLTKIRRHNENVLILGGEAPGRRWSKPVALPQVVRAAGDETENYTRVHYDQIPNVSLVPSAVADVMHLLAELIDNATLFSQDTVRVQVEPRSRGIVVRIEDQGIGMADRDLEHANDLFAGRSQFDLIALGNTDRKGHFVVARLATKHGIRVDLEQVYLGGTRATVSIPEKLIDREDSSDEPRDNAMVRTLVPGQGDNGISPSPSRRRRQRPQRSVNDDRSSRSNGTAEHGAIDPHYESGRHRNRIWTEPSAADPEPVAEPNTKWLSGTLPGVATDQPSPKRAAHADAPDRAAARPQASQGRAPLPKRTPRAQLNPQLLHEPTTTVTNELPWSDERTPDTAANLMRKAWAGRIRSGAHGQNGESEQ
ncbi:ATP-binding protein [Saccharopolyspora sp. K220]|uniref:sensor histidine kinase n=1 Tax=Saccharopolyspora soli TaxID=2926618 RepID=UPI001F5A48FA|nr:ATP-binding protein [Saccharopolyspora soli]MCI2416637.1 ATP-binding protein [Saccharopolyspora soli]